ncbi:hypothetical protein CALVIDRAFT_133875 [Calocera viscosa TUFC12733]|uniref:Uncharacterized protein n=1 Tax=Calocera viscosa (strain TUFC12733) TaxID=1330018 RepID=A0A167RXM3_CALVF|nr:hypothetical protein CALVIDRAFT_133875 [Calocera viscosa TUFC12733]
MLRIRDGGGSRVSLGVVSGGYGRRGKDAPWFRFTRPGRKRNCESIACPNSDSGALPSSLAAPLIVDAILHCLQRDRMKCALGKDMTRSYMRLWTIMEWESQWRNSECIHMLTRLGRVFRLTDKTGVAVGRHGCVRDGGMTCAVRREYWLAICR